ncbi:MAG: sigma factor-like helix-turn-helix DNA-binding protein, partial [Phycicoccus sp.]
VDMHGLSVAEAAATLDIAEGTVKSRCFRGRAALAELLGLEQRHRDAAPSAARSAPDDTIAEAAVPGADDAAEIGTSSGAFPSSGTTTVEPRSAP